MVEQRSEGSNVKKTILAVLLFLSAFAWSKDTPVPSNDTINVHVSKSCIGAHGEQRLDVTIDGKKYELAATGNGWLLALGDYKAKLVKDAHRGTYDSFQIYEFLFPDQKTRKFNVVGQTE
jgi:hypothetical protein